MFNLRDFILRGLKESVSTEPAYKVIERASNWLDKGVLIEADLEELSALLPEETPEETAEQAEVVEE